jgi:ATP-dependent Clp protease ATP-binding subunit ClpC
MSESLRVYMIRDVSGLTTGRIVPRSGWVDLAASGMDEEQCLQNLEQDLAKFIAENGAEGLLWDEHFSTSKVLVEVRPEVFVQKRRVIGKDRIPIELSYAWSVLPSTTPGGAESYRVLLPRFGWSFLLEDLAMAADVLRQTVSTQLSGENARSLFDFREQAKEYVVEWAPKLLRKKPPRRQRDEDAFSTLHSVAEDWTENARRGRLGLHLGDPDHERFTALLASERKPSVLLVGPSGVGKTAWVRELARRMAQTESNATRLWASSADRIMAGMMYLGMWEQRCLDLVAELSGEGHFLYVDRLAAFAATRSDRSSIADLLLPALRNREISVIAECTAEEYQRIQLTAPALTGAFQAIHLRPLEPELTARRMTEYQARKNQSLTLHPEAVRRLVRHLGLYRKDSAFPGKAFVFLDWLAHQPGQSGTLRARDADRAFARYSGLPERLISDDELGPSQLIASELERAVIGQDHACALAADVLTRFKAGINDPEKPIGSLLFVGPTGVGKTELAKQLAGFVFGSAERMIRLDMSEYLSPAATLRLVDDSAGQQSLAARVAQQPLSLVLLDEIEKAHPAVFDLLLGVLGEGRLTASSGRFVDFRMSLVVMTSNLGTGATRVGFGSEGADAKDALKAVRQHFRPEFFNRLDHIVPFAELSPAALRTIVRLELDKVRQREGLTRRQITLAVSEAAEALLAELGWHPQFGARPLTRVIEERVLTPIAVELARKPTLAGARVTVERGPGSELSISFAR